MKKQKINKNTKVKQTNSNNNNNEKKKTNKRTTKRATKFSTFGNEKSSVKNEYRKQKTSTFAPKILQIAFNHRTKFIVNNRFDFSDYIEQKEK